MNKQYIPERNHIIWLDFEPVKGKEIGKYRPTLVLSSRVYNQQTGLVMCCPISTSIRGHATEVSISNLDQPCVVAASMTANTCRAIDVIDPEMPSQGAAEVCVINQTRSFRKEEVCAGLRAAGLVSLHIYRVPGSRTLVLNIETAGAIGEGAAGGALSQMTVSCFLHLEPSW